MLGAYGQASLGEALVPLFERWGGMQTLAAQSTSAVVILVALTTLQMVLGELVPKSLALQYPTGVARLTVLPIRWSERAMAWFIAILNGSGWLILRVIGVDPKPHRHLHSAEEIRFLVAESREVGNLEPEEQRRVNHALGLTQRTARELMVPRIRIAAVDEAAGFATAVEAAATVAYTRLPVYRESIDNIVGLLHAKDLAAVALGGAGPEETSLAPLVRPMLAVHESVTVNRLLSLFRKEKGIMAVVVDDFGGTAGIITMEDVLTELLGEVADEFKPAGGEPERVPDGRLRLPGDLPVRDVPAWVGFAWEGQADTVGGLVMERLRADPGDRATPSRSKVCLSRWRRSSGARSCSVLVRLRPRHPTSGGSGDDPHADRRPG